ncbi:MAG: YciI family protein [Phycisphaerales bacterium JB038]
MPEATQHLYRLQPTRIDMLETGPTAREGAIIEEHFAYLQRLCGERLVLLAGRTLTEDADAFGIVILNADETRARALMEADPAVRGGVMTATLFPFKVALPAGF